MSDPFYKYDGWIERHCAWVDAAFCLFCVVVFILGCIPYWIYQAIKRKGE